MIDCVVLFIVSFTVPCLFLFVVLSLSPSQMRQNAAGQVRPSLPNGPSSDPSLPSNVPGHPHPMLSRTPSSSSSSSCSVPAGPTANGPFPSSPAPLGVGGGTDGTSAANNHAAGAGPGSNGNVPYLQPHALPHNRTTPTSTADEAWEHQRVNATQVRPGCQAGVAFSSL